MGAHWFWTAAVEQGGYFAVGIEVDEAAAELFAVADVDGESVVFRARMTRFEQFLEHHCHLYAVGRRERIELEVMATHREILVLARASSRAVDAGELPAALRIGAPHFGRGIGRVGQSLSPCLAGSVTPN